MLEIERLPVRRRKSAGVEELEEEIEVDDAQSISYYELFEAFQPSLRAPLLTRAQPNSEDEVPQQVVWQNSRWGLNSKSLS